jgi:hypothetical protein
MESGVAAAAVFSTAVLVDPERRLPEANTA